MSVNLSLPLRLIPVVVILAAAAPARAEPAPAVEKPALTLELCLERVRALNPGLRAARHRAAAARERAVQARALSNPRLEVELENFGGRGDFRGWEGAEATFSLRQEIELGGKLGARRETAAADAAGAASEYQARIRDLVRETRRAFVGALLAREEHRLAREAAGMAAEAEEATLRRVEAGRASPLEANRVRAETARASGLNDRAGREAASTRRALAALWGEDTDDFDLAPDRLDQVAVEVADLELLLAGIARTPEIARAEAAVRAAEGRRRGESAERIPDLEISAGWRRFEDSGESAFVAGLGVGLPFFNRNTSGIRAADADLEAARLEEAALRDELALRVRWLYANFRSRRERAESLKNIGLPVSEQALAAARTGYREGRFGYLEVLDARRLHTELQTEYARTLAELQETAADLERLTGTPLNTIQ